MMSSFVRRLILMSNRSAAKAPQGKWPVESLERRRGASGVSPAIELGHDRVENPTKRNRDEVVNKRHRGGRAEIDLSECNLDQIDGQERRGATRPAAGDDERLG